MSFYFFILILFSSFLKYILSKLIIVWGLPHHWTVLTPWTIKNFSSYRIREGFWRMLVLFHASSETIRYKNKFRKFILFKILGNIWTSYKWQCSKWICVSNPVKTKKLSVAIAQSPYFWYLKMILPRRSKWNSWIQ